MAALPIGLLLTLFEVLAFETLDFAFETLDFGAQLIYFLAQVIHQVDRFRGGASQHRNGSSWQSMPPIALPKMLEGCDGGQASSRPSSERGGVEQTGAIGEGCDGGQASRRPSSETGTRRGVKQNTEAEKGSSLVAESNHLLLVNARGGNGFTE